MIDEANSWVACAMLIRQTFMPASTIFSIISGEQEAEISYVDIRRGIVPGPTVQTTFVLRISDGSDGESLGKKSRLTCVVTRDFAVGHLE